MLIYRRYATLSLMALVLCLCVLFGFSFLAQADDPPEKKPMQIITAFTTLPVENAAVISDEYEAATRIRVNFVPLSSEELINRLAAQSQIEYGAAGKAAVVLADQATLRKAAERGYLTPYISEAEDAVPDKLKQVDGLWTGVWYDPIVFCANRTYVQNSVNLPRGWTELATNPRCRVGVTDFLAADASANLFTSMVGAFGEDTTYDIWRQIHPRVKQYARYLSGPVRQAGMGETDISVAVQSEALRYINDGYPLQIIYPEEGTAYYLIGEGVVRGIAAGDAATAGAFADWLLSDDAQLALQKHDFFFVPTNPATLTYKTFAGKNMFLFEDYYEFESTYKHRLLDRWVKEIRLGGY